MWGSAIAAYLHYLGLMVSFGALLVEGLTVRKDLDLKNAWQLVIADSIYGVAATTVLITGILRVIYFGQGREYYLHSPVFWVKVGIFIIVGLTSLYPTFTFVSWVSTLRAKQPPSLTLPQVNRLRWLIRTELTGFAIIPLLASMLARGMAGF